MYHARQGRGYQYVYGSYPSNSEVQVLVIMRVPHGKYWHCVMSKHEDRTATYSTTARRRCENERSYCVLRPLQKTRGLTLTIKSWSWRCTAKDLYINH